MSKQFIAKAFKEEAKQYGIKLIYGKPYHLRGRDKIEGYHKALYRELISVDRFGPTSGKNRRNSIKGITNGESKRFMDGKLLRASTMIKNTLIRRQNTCSRSGQLSVQQKQT